MQMIVDDRIDEDWFIDEEPINQQASHGKQPEDKPNTEIKEDDEPNKNKSMTFEERGFVESS